MQNPQSRTAARTPPGAQPSVPPMFATPAQTLPTPTSHPRRLSYDYSAGFARPVYATGTVEQPDTYTQTDHEVWRALVERQDRVLENRAAPLYLEGRRKLGLDSPTIPRFSDLSKILKAATGWELVAVEGLLPGEVFFRYLTERRFPVTWWIRSPEEMDYLPEPDLFHDLYGHVPMFMNQDFADFVCLYGQTSERIAGNAEIAAQLDRLYWYTVEFGLMGTPEHPVISGAGILSSAAESVYATDSPKAERVMFDLDEVLHRPYRIDQMQDRYFVIDDFSRWVQSVRPALEAMGR